MKLKNIFTFIGIILILIGLIGLIINIIFNPSFKELIYHTYSTIPGILGIMCLFISLVINLYEFLKN